LIILATAAFLLQMVTFTTTILKFDDQGEKTGRTYISIPAKIAQQLKPGNKKSFRVKGKLDKYTIKEIALMPMGGGDFIMAINAVMRKGIGKRKGAILKVQLMAEDKPPALNRDLLECLADEPAAQAHFATMPRSHQLYFSKWIDSAKTSPTKIKRIAMAVAAMAKKMDFGAMLRAQKKDNQGLQH
jgi:hypothetical protein